MRRPPGNRGIPSPPGTHRSAGGFTIVECLLAGMILALFATTIATTVAQAGAAARHGENLRLAADRMNEVFTRIDMIGPSRLIYEGPTRGELDARFAWQADIEEGVLTDLYDIKVTIRWSADGKARSIVGYTQLYDPSDAARTPANWYDF